MLVVSTYLAYGLNDKEKRGHTALCTMCSLLNIEVCVFTCWCVVVGVLLLLTDGTIFPPSLLFSRYSGLFHRVKAAGT